MIEINEKTHSWLFNLFNKNYFIFSGQELITKEELLNENGCGVCIDEYYVNKLFKNKKEIKFIDCFNYLYKNDKSFKYFYDERDQEYFAPLEWLNNTELDLKYSSYDYNLLEKSISGKDGTGINKKNIFQVSKNIENVLDDIDIFDYLSKDFKLFNNISSDGYKVLILSNISFYYQIFATNENNLIIDCLIIDDNQIFEESFCVCISIGDLDSIYNNKLINKAEELIKNIQDRQKETGYIEKDDNFYIERYNFEIEFLKSIDLSLNKYTEYLQELNDIYIKKYNPEARKDCYIENYNDFKKESFYLPKFNNVLFTFDPDTFDYYGWGLNNNTYNSNNPIDFRIELKSIQKLLSFEFFLSHAEVKTEVKNIPNTSINTKNLSKIEKEKLSNIPITVINKNYFTTTINNHDYPVRGHFRLQPIGEKRTGKKLIWINDFVKHQYIRVAKKLKEEVKE